MWAWNDWLFIVFPKSPQAIAHKRRQRIFYAFQCEMFRCEIFQKTVQLETFQLDFRSIRSAFNHIRSLTFCFVPIVWIFTKFSINSGQGLKEVGKNKTTQNSPDYVNKHKINLKFTKHKKKQKINWKFTKK